MRISDGKILRVSVRNLVEFLLRSGDIDNRCSGRREMDAMQAGSRLHRKIQGRMGSRYQSEVSLKRLVEFESGISVSVEGRADGIWTDEKAGFMGEAEPDGEAGSGPKYQGIVTVDEIKGIYRDVSRMEGAVPVHLAQAKCYACIYARQQDLERIRVRMVYANLDTEELRYFTEDYAAEELEAWFSGLMREYERWVSHAAMLRELRQESLKTLKFPYAYREGQREVAVSVYKTILRKKRLFIQAPTGVGKTLSTLFPSLKAMGEDLGEKIFYLTARTITRTVAGDALDLLREQGMRVKSVVLTAKEKLCVCEEAECNPEHCPCAKGHFDRINEAVFDLWTAGPDSCTREAILEQAHKYRVCPFELNLDLSTWVDVIICDYNYVFDPNVYLKRFFAEGVKGDYLFLIDEAHNLVERGRDMYSASLYKEDFLEMKRLVKGKDAGLVKALERCNSFLLTLKRECEDGFQILPRSGAVCSVQLNHLMTELERFLELPSEEELRKKLLDFYFQVRDFLNISDRVDENYEVYTELTEDGRFALRLYCVRPAVNLKECLDKGNSSIFFSATLLPVNYYKDLLTGETEDYAVYARSPFDQEKRLLLVGTDVSSRYSRRNEREYERMAEYVRRTVRSKKGNYLVFFPSYRMLEEVYQRCCGAEDFCCIRQDPGMDEAAREEFLARFEEERDESMAAFCVMGGIFSEGIDLTGNRLTGAVVIGTGLPQVCREREILRQYFDKRGMDGFAYAYLYPGMNKVLQAAGRVIRTDKDEGVILLLDGRFRTPAYQSLFPREWERHSYCRLNTVEEDIRTFWAEKNTPRS